MDHETADDIKRHFDVVAEGMRDDVQLVAEGVSLLREESDAFRRDVAREFQGVARQFEGVAREFDETRTLIRLSYSGDL
jgi:hypothetical protein